VYFRKNNFAKSAAHTQSIRDTNSLSPGSHKIYSGAQAWRIFYEPRNTRVLKCYLALLIIAASAAVFILLAAVAR